jgi:hypothetical protein
MRGVVLCLTGLWLCLGAGAASAHAMPACSDTDLEAAREVSQEDLETHAGRTFGRLTIAPGQLGVFGLKIGLVVDETGRVACLSVRDAIPFMSSPQFQATPERQAFLTRLADTRFSAFLQDGSPLRVSAFIFVDEEERPLYNVIAPHGDLSEAKIEIERHDHHNGPFVLSIDGAGSVIYRPLHGDGFGDIIGLQSYRVSPAQVAAIIEAAEKSGFWSWRESYRPDYGSEFQVDQDGYGAFYDRISITYGGRTKTVRSYREGGAPFAFTDLFDDFATRTKADIWRMIDAPMVDQLTENGFNFPSTKGGKLLVRATGIRQVPQAVIDRLIALGAPQNVVLDEAMFDTSLLDAAISGRRIAMVDQLLAAGALAKDREAATRALMNAVEDISPDMVAKILPYGPKLSIMPNPAYPTRNGDAIPIITFAAQRFRHSPDIVLSDQISVVQQLLDTGADINSRDDEGHSLLDKVINEEDRPFAEWLMAHGAVRHGRE